MRRFLTSQSFNPLARVAISVSTLALAMAATGCGDSGAAADAMGGGATAGTDGSGGPGTGGQGGPGAGGTGTGPAGGGAGNLGGAPAAGGTGVIGGTGGVATLPPPPSDCGSVAGTSALPRAFEVNCSGCHSITGAQNTRFPDLYQFAGSQADLVTKVRGGTALMPVFPTTAISDEDLAAVFTYFTTATREGAVAAAVEGIVPLFASSETTLPPIHFIREDGVLITRGAGRVRGRHELEETYSPFHPHYFEDRSYGFMIEDHVTAGGNSLVVYYLPKITPDADGNRRTNYRAWKIYDNGNVFYDNSYMNDGGTLPIESTAPYAAVQSQTVTMNPRTGMPIQEGDIFEFEFGLFLTPGELTSAGSRNSYYTDTFRYRVGVGGVTPENYDTSGQPGPLRPSWLGGDTTVAWIYAEPELYFSQMALNIQHENVQNFLEGRRLFHTQFDTGEHTEEGNPTFTEQAGKAGPLFNTTTCDTCHENNGPGTALEGSMGEDSSMVFKLYNSGDLGNQLQPQEGTASIGTYEESQVQLGDGTMVTLKKPTITVTPNSGTVGGFSARIARKLVGMGLLEAISEEAILARADELDCNQDGISGRPMYVNDPVTGEARLGRIGWKAEKISVQHQVADALSADLGVFTSIIPGPGGEMELSDDDVLKLTTYMRLLGAPPRRNETDPQIVHGEEVFNTVGCANCHAPAVTTANTHPFLELRNQPIHPYSDLLLHDMGENLTDNSGEAFASEWRTPPLWGVGLLGTVSAHTGLLHDGRAASVLEAVLWHGGEAQTVRDSVVALPAADRDALVAFVGSL